jgi:undecaprenyl-diphosphatase
MASARLKYVLAIFCVCPAVLLLVFFDAQLSGYVQHIITPVLKSIGKLLSQKGLFLFYGIFVLLFVYSYAKKNQNLRKICFAYLTVQLLFSFLLVRLMKIIFGRARPRIGSEFTFFSLDSGYNSFPSGHAADAFVSGIFLFYLLKKSSYSAYRHLPLFYASVVALSRIVVNAHFPSDVLAGAAIGVFSAWFYSYFPLKPKYLYTRASRAKYPRR